MILCGTTISFLAIKGFYTGEVRILHNRLYASFNSLISDPNDFAQIILMILPFAIYGLLNKRISILNKFILFSSIIAFLYVLILTGSRGGLLGLCAVTFFIWIKSRKKFRLFIIFLICAAIFWNFAPSQYKQRINSIKTASSEDASAVSRINAWKAGWKMMTHNILGVGAGNFSQGFYKYKPSDVYTPVGKRIPAHNMFIQIGSETGFGGLISFLALFFYSFKSLSALNKIKSNSNELEEIKLFANATYVSLGGYGVTGIFLSQAYSWFLYYLFAFSVALHYISQHILDKKEKT
jgi:probable O-glycosylation ligase (exosortase A-associated)